MTITERAREIAAETGCGMVDAVSQVYDELDPDRTAYLVNAAGAWAAVLSVEYPGHAFLGVVKPPRGSRRRPIEVAPDPELMDRARRAAAVAERDRVERVELDGRTRREAVYQAAMHESDPESQR